MGRSNFKFLYYSEKDLCSFFKKINPNFEYNSNNTRYMTLNKLNLLEKRYVYQGQNKVYFKSSEYCLGYKLGMFSKTRRPFFFRQKKKR